MPSEYRPRRSLTWLPFALIATFFATTTLILLLTR